MWKTMQILKNFCMIIFFTHLLPHITKQKVGKKCRITSTHRKLNPLQGDKFLSTEKNTVEFLSCLVAAEFYVYASHVG